MPRYVSMTATIAAGESISSVIDCSAGRPTMIFLPDQWTPAHLTFQVSVDDGGTTFNDLFTSDGAEVIRNVVAGTAVPLPLEWAPVLFLRLRSGSRDAPVPQDATCSLGVTLDTRASATPATRVVVAEA
jgi:hypothetical protein